METNRNIVIEFYYEREQSSLKTSYLLKTALIIMQGMLREKKNSIATPNLACTQTLFYFSFRSVRARDYPLELAVIKSLITHARRTLKRK